MNNRGSVWNKWDLHIHTPKSICNEYGADNTETWEKFITSLENLPEEVKVIGINDYYFIDGFEKVLDYKFNKGRLSNLETIFPVLEFRIDTFSSASQTKFQKVNLHILFEIDYSKWQYEVEKIKAEFIQQIHLSKLESHKTKILSKENLTLEGGNLQVGFNEIIPSTEEVFNIINSETWKNRTFILLGYKEWNNLEKGYQLRSFKEALYQKVDAFFTASPDDNFAKKQEVLDRFGEKILIHSSDIHDFSKLDKDNYRCLTWIKSTTNFQGLKQILIEPSERIKIQETNPFLNTNKTQIIDEIRFSNTNKWFEEKRLELNSGLISIIGEKGAGKTALLDLIAVSNDEGIYEKEEKNPYSFYNRAKDKIKGLELNFKFLNGRNISKTFDGRSIRNSSDKNANVRYLSLKELESYCDDKYKFQDFIKDIILSTYPEVSEFDRKSKEIIENIKKLGNDIFSLSELTKGLDEKDKAIYNKELELENHLKNQPKVSKNFSKEQEEEYKGLIDIEQGLKSNLKNNDVELNEISNLIFWLENQKQSIEQNYINALAVLSNKYSIIPKDLVNNIKININFQNTNLLDNRINELKIDKRNIEKQLNDNTNKIKPLEELNKNLKQVQSIIKKWYEHKSILEKNLINLKTEKNNIENNLDQINVLKKQLQRNYINLIKVKIDQKKKYEELKTELESDNNITFDIKIEINEEKIFSIEDSIVKHGVGNSQEIIKEKLNEEFISIIKNCNFKDIEDEYMDIADMIDYINSDLFIKETFGENRTLENLFKKGFNLSNFYNWIYGDYFEVNYFINFKNRPLEALSPGQKGLVLMKIFLKLDKSNKPLLIDQPEDNLDNKSVYKDLVNDIREIKKKRQVIIATHNPNLVVNTDSEQVIIAKFEDNPSENEARIKYYSGALEDEYIRKEVCDILEGGELAFNKREERYFINR